MTTATGQVAGARGELVEAIASRSGLSKADAKRALDGFTNATIESLRKGDRISLVGFGSFSISKRAARTGRNPKTDKEIQGNARDEVRFEADRELVAALDLIPGRGDERRLPGEKNSRGTDADHGDDGMVDEAETVLDANALARESGLSKSDAKRALDGIVEAMTGALSRDRRLSLVGFGSFSISKRSARTGRNPRTGKEIRSNAREEVRFKAGAELSKSVN